MNKLRIYFQPYERAAELKEVKVFIADEEMNFEHLDSFPGGPGPVQQGKYAEFSMDGVTTQAIRLEPEYDGWGHMWGEVEFWVYDTGDFEAPVFGLAPGETYYYRAYGSNNGGSSWAPYTKSFRAEDKVAYDSGKLVIHTDLGTWKHSNGDFRQGELVDSFFTDQFGNGLNYTICRFEFDQIELIGELDIEIKGENALEIVTTSGDVIISTEIDMSGSFAEGETAGKAGAGGFAGGAVGGRGIGPGGGLGGTTPGGGGYGGAGSRATSTTGQPYGNGALTDLLGGSGGGGYTVDSAGGGGGGAIRIISVGDLKLYSTLRSLGGSGVGGSAGGAGGAVHLRAQNLYLDEKSSIDVSGGNNGGAGGRIFLEGSDSLVNFGFDNLIANGGEGAISGTPGSVRYLRPADLADLNFQTGTLSIDTDSAIMTHSDGSIAFGEIVDNFYKDQNGAFWPYSVCVFKFTDIRLGGNLVVRLVGKNALELEATSGSLVLGANLKANGGNAQNENGGVGVLGGFSGSAAGQLIGKGPGSPLQTATAGHGAAYGGHGSGEAKIYGDPAITSLIGGSSGGSSSNYGSGAGGGAISLKASNEVIIEPNVLVSVNGGNGGDNSAAGTGGAIRLEATRIFNYGTLQARAGNGVKLSGNDHTRGSSGGRIAFMANGQVQVGQVDLSGEWLSNDGMVFVGGSHLDSTLNVEDSLLTINTASGYFSVEGGAHGLGVITPHTFTDNLGQNWEYEICSFTFSQISINGGSQVKLLGDKPLILKTVAGGNIFIGADFILDGGDASNENGYGGKPTLNPWRGRSSQRLNGFGPGGPPAGGNWGVGANYNYGDEQITHLLPGSSGSSGMNLQGSGAGGGALAIEADGDLIISEGVVIRAQGGDGRTNGSQWNHGGGGSGGAIRLKGNNVINRGLIKVDGGNRGASGGRIAIASSGDIEQGVISVGSGSYTEIRPPSLQIPEKIYVSYQKAASLKKKIIVGTRPQNLVAYFPMDESQGLLAEDAISGKKANLVGGTSWVNGVIGSAIHFNGTNAYLATGLKAEDINVDGKRARTISFWTKVEGNPRNDSGFYGYGSLLNTDGANQYWALRRIDNSSYTRFQSEHWGWGPWISHGSSLLNVWSHIVHSYDGSNMLLYRDGNLIYSAARAEIGTGNQVDMQIGRWRNDSNAYFFGLIDEFRVYDDALTQNEILSIFAGNDVSQETLQMQFEITASNKPSNFTATGLPEGLLLNAVTGEVTGLPQEVGVFDLNVTAGNQAGEALGLMQLIVNKTPPSLVSVPPKNLSSTSARFAGKIISDGGDPTTVSLFGVTMMAVRVLP